jgi:arginine/lysine/ornithine decarboxylase
MIYKKLIAFTLILTGSCAYGSESFKENLNPNVLRTNNPSPLYSKEEINRTVWHYFNELENKLDTFDRIKVCAKAVEEFKIFAEDGKGGLTNEGKLAESYISQFKNALECNMMHFLSMEPTLPTKEEALRLATLFETTLGRMDMAHKLYLYAKNLGKPH